MTRKIACVLLACALLLPGCTGLVGEPQITFYTEAYMDAYRAVEAFAKDRDIEMSEYPESLIALLSRNPETEAFVLEYPWKHAAEHTVDMSEYADCTEVPLFLQWDSRWGYIQYGADVAGLTGCGPVCLSMAAYYITRDESMSPDNMLHFSINNGYCVPGNGTAWALISEGGRKLGLDVTEIPLDKDRLFANLEVGNPVICIMGPGDFTTSGHFIVMIGVEDGKIRVNDPNSLANSAAVWEYEAICSQIRNLWVIRGM